MPRKNKNNINIAGQKLLTISALVIATNAGALISFSSAVQASDMISGADLLESPLSMSLSTVPTTANSFSQISLSQNGIYNNASITQASNASNSISVLQNGVGNEATITQFGEGNVVNLSQYGVNNLADILQDGNANVVNLTQFGEQTFSIHQVGDGMAVSITQL